MIEELEPIKHTFKTPLGNWLTASLFLETEYNTDAIFTLWDDDREFKGKHYISLKKLYLEMEDPTEYDFATTYLGGWRHWVRFEKNAKLRVAITEWREELILRLRAKGVKAMISEATMGGRGQATAARWLSDKGFLDSASAKGSVGRPKKDTSEQDAALKIQIEEDCADDLARIKLN